MNPAGEMVTSPRTSSLDAARAVRSGEHFDERAVDAWIKDRVPDMQGTPNDKKGTHLNLKLGN